MPETAEDKLNDLVARVGKVRRWLVALAILKVAALCLVFASAYIGVYAWLDHRFEFGEVGRVAALALLLAGMGLILHRLMKLLLRHISCSGAANYIESRISLNQQLVTAIEYHENKQQYPYSRSLAEQLVLRVNRDCGEISFDSTVEKWRGYVLGAIILFGLVTAWLYIRDNYLYFSAYFARLTQPVASVAPLSNTRLEPITEDIVAEPNSEVTFAAEIEGRPPELAKLVLVKLEPDAAEEGRTPEPEEMQVRPTEEGRLTPRLEASKSFSETGRFKYRFATESAETDWYELNICPAPQIENMKARVAIPKNPTREQWIEPYSEQIDDETLEVIHDSGVSLKVQASDKLKEVAITGLDDKTVTKQLNGATEFDYHFKADRKGTVEFDLVNEKGLANEDVRDLEIVVKTDEPPKFKLVSPEGDYLTTDVASVPIRFEITDDFGLESAKMHIEIPGYQPKEMVIPIEKGARSKEHGHTIELEEYDLRIGDSILFSAEATDVDTGSAQENRTSSSEVYFIEIRPYRQNWRAKPGGGKPGKGGMPPPVELLNILEYTRAVVKKTWAVAAKAYPTEQDLAMLDSVDNDVQYCAEQLAIIRDDPEYGFAEGHTVVLNSVIRYYKRASKYLAERNADSALVPAKDAYRLLRKFIIELELMRNPPPSGQSPQPKRPDSVKMQENPEFSEYEKERIEAEIKKVQQELTRLTREQKGLRRTFENFLEQQARQANGSQEDTDGKSPDESGKQQSPGGQSGSQQNKTADSQKSEGSSGGQSGKGEKTSAESSSASGGQSAGEGKPASGDPRADETQPSTESGQPSKDENAGAKDGASTGRDGGDKQASAESGQSSKGESAGNEDGTSTGENAEGKQGSAGSRGYSEGEGGDEGKGATEDSVLGSEQGASGGQSGAASEGQGATESKGESASQGQGGSQGKGGAEDSNSGDKQESGEGSGYAEGQPSGKNENGQWRGTGDGEGSVDARSWRQGQGAKQRAAANAEARLRMLQAKQRALQEQIAQLKRDLQQLPQASDSDESQGRTEAQDHLDKALAKMDDFQEKLAAARYRAEMGRKESQKAVELMESAEQEMEMATQSLDGELTLSEEEKLAREAQKMAEQLAEDAEALDASLTPDERKDMLARLEAARRMLELMPEPQWATPNQSRGTQPPLAPVLTRGAGRGPAETARQLARQFWSISIDARKRQHQLTEDEPSDVKFFGQENEFFENAAGFDAESVQE